VDQNDYFVVESQGKKTTTVLMIQIEIESISIQSAERWEEIDIFRKGHLKVFTAF